MGQDDMIALLATRLGASQALAGNAGDCVLNVNTCAKGFCNFRAVTPCTMQFTVEVLSIQLNPISGLIAVSAPTPATLVSAGN